MIADNFELETPEHRRHRSLEEDEMMQSSLLNYDFISNDEGNNSKSLSQPLLLSKEDDDEHAVDPAVNNNNTDGVSKDHDNAKLLLSFFLMLIVGTFNKIFQKLQAIPMYNYPNSLNLLQNFIYVPLCFLYILPVSTFGLFNNAIPHEVSSMNKKPFIVLGLLDCVTCLLMTFAAVYLPGSLLILLPQAAIPISMILSNQFKGERYRPYQYIGAVVVLLGIGVVLEPLLTQRHDVGDYTCEATVDNVDKYCTVCSVEVDEVGCLSHRTKGEETNANNDGGSLMNFVRDYVTATTTITNTLQQDNQDSASSGMDDSTTIDGSICQWIPMSDAADNSSSESSSTLLLWSIVTILACVPMTLSSIYKEIILSNNNSSNNNNNSVDIDPIYLNGWVAFYQFLFSFPLAFPAGMFSNPPISPSELPSNIMDGITCYLGEGTITNGCHPDDQCYLAPLYVNLFLVFNVGFNILIVYILKYGSANVLFLAGTVMVPIGNIAFALPFMPGHTPLHDSDVAGLLVILTGLITYRFGNAFGYYIPNALRTIPPCPWRRNKNQYIRDPSLLNEKTFEWDAALPVDDLVQVPSQEVMRSLLSQSLD